MAEFLMPDELKSLYNEIISNKSGKMFFLNCKKNHVCGYVLGLTNLEVEERGLKNSEIEILKNFCNYK